MLGYALTGYRLWNIKKEKVIILRDVKFDENKFWFQRKIEIFENCDEQDFEIIKQKENEDENDEFFEIEDEN